MNAKRIAVLGTGAMGCRMAQDLLSSNHQVVVYNRTSDKIKLLLNQSAVYAAMPREAAQQADIVISMITDDDVSRKVWLDPETGAVLGLGKDSIAIKSSTLTVNWTRELAAEIEKRGATFLDQVASWSRIIMHRCFQSS